MSLKSKKVPNQIGGHGGPGQQQDIRGVYNPTTMLESWVFGKSNANDGTSVESVGSTANFEQLDDIKYFLRRLLKQFKVPFTRFEAPESINEQSESLSYEEYSFSRMEIRLQRRFAIGLKRSFITHLRLRGIWDKYNLKDDDIELTFTPPVLYDLYQIQKLMDAKVNAYATLGDRDEFSKIIAMKKILHMTDEEIKDNFDNLAKEKVWMQGGEYYASKVDENGPEPVMKEVRNGISEGTGVSTEDEAESETEAGEDEGSEGEYETGEPEESGEDEGGSESEPEAETSSSDNNEEA